MKLKFAVAAAVSALFLHASPASQAVILSPGDILVTDISSNSQGAGPLGIIKVDPATGDRTIVSGFGVGSGPDIIEPFGVVVALNGDILVSDLYGESIFRVDPTTGDRTLVSGPGVGAGPAFGGAVGIALGPGNSLIVTTASTHESAGVSYGDVYRVDLATGDRTTLSSSFLGIGTGPDMYEPAGVVIGESGEVLVADFSNGGRILSIDALTGDRSLLSGDQVGTGTHFSGPIGMALEEDGSLLVSDGLLSAIFRVDPISGDRTLASGGAIGSGPELQSPVDVAVNPDGTIFATLLDVSALYAIDPITGNRALLSGDGVGLGPDFAAPSFITVVPVPEPSTALLFITGMLFLVAVRRRSH